MFMTKRGQISSSELPTKEPPQPHQYLNLLTEGVDKKRCGSLIIGSTSYWLKSVLFTVHQWRLTLQKKKKKIDTPSCHFTEHWRND